MESIEKKVIGIVEKERNYKDHERIKDLINATQQFKILIEKGFVEPRGNNLLSVDDAHLKRCVFNAPI